MKDSKISWTDDTINFWIGCEKVSEACTECYAEFLDAKFKYGGQPNWGKDAPRYLRVEKAVSELMTSERKAIKKGQRRKVFINSMSDFFEDREDLVQARSIACGFFEKCTMLDIQLLTKRPQNILKMVPQSWTKNWPEHVWIGTTVELQKWANVRIPKLLEVPAKVRWLSCEPLLGRLDLSKWIRWACSRCNWDGEDRPFKEDDGDPQCPKCGATDHNLFRYSELSWIVAGGKSGKNWQEDKLELRALERLRCDCLIGNIKFFAKQDSGVKPGQRGRIPDDLWVHEMP